MWCVINGPPAWGPPVRRGPQRLRSARARRRRRYSINSHCKCRRTKCSVFYTMASTASIDDDSMDAATSDDRDLVRKACTYITEGAYIGHVQSSTIIINYQHHVRLATCRNLLLPHNLMRHAKNVDIDYIDLRHVEASRIYLVCLWLVPQLVRNGGDKSGPTMAATIGPGDQLWRSLMP